MLTILSPVSDNEEDAKLCAESFDPATYLRDYLKDVKTGEEAKQLQALRQKLNGVSLASAESLKKNVFISYQQFIDTSKEVSHLEREIYELSSQITEQRLLIENLMQMNGDDRSSICTASSHTASSSSNIVNILMQKMDGMAAVLNNIKGSDKIILHGEVTQLDIDTKKELCSVMLVLLTDRILIGHPYTGKYRFQLESSHQLNAIAAVNVKDREGGEVIESAFKLLIFPDQRVYRCENARVKKEWLDAIDMAKKNLLHEGSLIRQATIRVKRKTFVEHLKTPEYHDATNSTAMNHRSEPELASDERSWMNELPAELDDCIAHRDMEHAVELITEWKSCKLQDAAIDAQLTLREAHIVQLLCDEVRRPGALHGGPRAVRKAINLLTGLGHASTAIDLYLKKRSAALRQSAREVTVSEEPLSYVRQLSQLYLGTITDIVTEFATQPEHFSIILQWCSSELSVMLSLIRRNVIEIAPTMAVLAHTWRILISHCESLALIGVDLTFEVHGLLAASLKAALETNFTNIMESMRLRISEERWRMYNMESESNVNRFLEEMSDTGLCIDWAVSSTHNACINISQNACHFSRVAHSVCRDLSVLRSSHLRSLTDHFVEDLWREYLEHLATSPCSLVHQYTATFIVSQLAPLCDSIYDGSTSGILSRLLESEFPSLEQFKGDGDVSQYEDEEEIAQV